MTTRSSRGAACRRSAGTACRSARAPRSARPASASTARRCARASSSSPLGDHAAHRFEQARALVVVERSRATRTARAARATARRRRSRGRRPTTVRWSRSSVWTRRRSSPWRISSANSSESGSGPSFARAGRRRRAQHPPRRLALVAVLAHERGLPFGEAQPHDGALGAGALGRLLDVEAARLREVDQDPPGVAEVEDEVLGVAADALERGADRATRATAPPSSAPRSRAARPPRARRRRPRRRGARTAPASAAARACADLPRSAATPRQPPRLRASCGGSPAARSCRSRNVSVSTLGVDEERRLHRVGVGRGELRVDADLAHDPLAVRLARSTCRSTSSAGACRGRARGSRWRRSGTSCSSRRA